MSLYRIETKKKIVVGGTEYAAEIDKTFNIDFSAAEYKAKLLVWEDPYEEEIELVPDKIDFLHEVTNVFPLTEYDISIRQFAPYNRRNKEGYVSIVLLIEEKETGERVYHAESADLSDKDYEYIREILIRDIPQYTWMTAEQRIRSSIEQCLGDGNQLDLFSDEAWDIFTKMVSARYRECKTDRYVDFDWDVMQDIAKDVLENALKYAFHTEGYEDGDK